MDGSATQFLFTLFTAFSTQYMQRQDAQSLSLKFELKLQPIYGGDFMVKHGHPLAADKVLCMGGRRVLAQGSIAVARA